jgi:hypothetical protein
MELNRPQVAIIANDYDACLAKFPGGSCDAISDAFCTVRFLCGHCLRKIITAAAFCQACRLMKLTAGPHADESRDVAVSF